MSSKDPIFIFLGLLLIGLSILVCGGEPEVVPEPATPTGAMESPLAPPAVVLSHSPIPVVHQPIPNSPMGEPVSSQPTVQRARQSVQ